MRNIPVVLLAFLFAACSSSSSVQESPWPRMVPDGHDGPFTIFWGDDRPKEEGEYSGGRRHGHVRGYHADGSLAFEGDWANGEPVGEIAHHAQGGGQTVVETVQDGQLSGPRRQLDDTGRLRQLAHYEAGLPHGPETRWYAGGSRQLEAHWEHGERSGHWTRWSEDGRVEMEEHYFLREGQRVGHLSTVFGSDGHISQTHAVLHDEHWNSRVTTWFADGAQETLEEYRDGKQHGRHQQWDASGQLRLQGQHQDDHRIGTWESFTATGALAEEWTEGS